MESGAGSDAMLVARTQAGETQAFDRLVMRHRGRVLRIAQEIARDPEAAQDLAQQALLNAFRALPSLREGDRFGPWINTIVRRLGQEWIRNGARRPEPVEEMQLRGVPGVFHTTSLEPPSDVAARVQNALAQLSQRERRVLIRHYLHGLTCEEIAAEIGLAPGSIKRLLYHTRRKVRKECEEMAEGEQQIRGPRRLRVWIDGNVGPGPRKIFDRLRPALMSSICLAINKLGKTVSQIAEEVGAHEEYVREAVDELVALEVLVSPRANEYVANFIAFSAEDWRRLMRLIPEPAAQVAAQFTAAQGRLQTAYKRTPLAREWPWERVTWVVNAVLLANVAPSRWESRITPLSLPERPDGGRYWLGGHEEAPDLPSIWTNGLNSNISNERLQVSNFWTWQIERTPQWQHSRREDIVMLIETLTSGPNTETKLVAQAEGREEELRAALADLVQWQWVARENGRYRLNLPFLTQAESDVLTPEVDAIIDPIMREIVQPALQGVNAQLNKMGYGHRREQYDEWHVWLTRDMTGEALRYLMEQGVLPRPDDPASPDFAQFVWRRGLAVMDFGREY